MDFGLDLRPVPVLSSVQKRLTVWREHRLIVVGVRPVGHFLKRPEVVQAIEDREFSHVDLRLRRSDSHEGRVLGLHQERVFRLLRALRRVLPCQTEWGEKGKRQYSDPEVHPGSIRCGCFDHRPTRPTARD